MSGEEERVLGILYGALIPLHVTQVANVIITTD